MKSRSSRNNVRLLALGLIGMLVTLSVSACAPATPAAPDAVKVVILPYTSYGPFFIAQEEGFFAEENLAVEFVRFDSGTAPMPLLIQGDIDVLGSGPNVSLFNAIAEGSTIKIVADKGYLASQGCTYMALLATPDWIESYDASPVDALTGSKVSIDPTNFEAFMFEKVLADSGLTLADTLPQDIAPPSLSDAVENDAVDVISVGDPWITRLLDTNLVSVWKPYQEIVPDMQFGVVLFGPSLLDERPEVGVRFMKAYLKGVSQYNEGKTERNLEIMAEYTSLDVELLQRACWPPMSEDGTIATGTVDEFQAWALTQGLINQVSPVEAYWDGSFVEQATP